MLSRFIVLVYFAIQHPWPLLMPFFYLFIFSLPHCRVNEYRWRGVGLYLSGKRERKGTKRKMNALNKTLEICCTKNKKKLILGPLVFSFRWVVLASGGLFSLFLTFLIVPYFHFFLKGVSVQTHFHIHAYFQIFTTSQPEGTDRIADINLRQSPQAHRRPSCHGSERGRGR